MQTTILAANAPGGWSMLRLPDTGQTAGFTTTFGEDSDYTVNPPFFADNGDGTVTDNITGLIWQKADGGEMTWDNAGTYAKGLSLGSHSDWRLPTNHELFSILNHSRNPALDANYFTMSAAEYWWTSDAMAGDSSRVWVANSGGGTGPHPKNETISAGGTKRFHARCVRGTSPPTRRPIHSFKDNGDGTVTDLDTGLVWQQAEVSPAMNWEAALQYAESLSFVGYTDWRLPNIKELQSLNDETLTNPSIDRSYFRDAAVAPYWSSTTLSNQPTRAWFVDFQSGIASYDTKTANRLVRCVRGGSTSPVPGDRIFLATELLGRPTDTSVTVNAVPARDAEVYFEYGTGAGEYSGRTKAVAYAAGTPIEVAMGPLQPDMQYYYRIRYREFGDADFVAGKEHTFHTQRQRGSTFTIAIQADPHMDENSDPETYQLTLQNELLGKPDFLVDLGDTFMSDKLSQPTYHKVMERALLLRSYCDLVGHSVPLFLTLGNHEGEWGSRLSGSADSLPVWDTVIRKFYYHNPFPDGFYTGGSKEEKYVGLRKSYYAWEWGDALFVVLDPYWFTPKSPELSGDWSLTLGREQYEWLKRTLEDSRATFKFVFCHNLVGGWDKGGKMRGGVEAAKYLEWGGYNLDDTWGFDKARPGWAMPIHQLLVKNRVTIFFHGHDHFYGKQELDGVVYQEIPQPSAGNTDLGNRAASYGYVQGRLLGGVGYLSLRVSPSDVKVDYVQTWIPTKETSSRKNGMVADSYTVAGRARSSMDLNLAAGGSVDTATIANTGALQAGYATAILTSGSAPYGTAVFSVSQEGIVVSEAAVPASPPTTAARLFVDYGTRVPSGPEHLRAGPVDIYTGIAAVNRGSATANVTYTLRNMQAQILSVGHGILAPGAHRARFLHQLQELAPDFALPADFPAATRFGSLEISSDQPLSIVALRMTINQRGSSLFTTIPIADLTQALSSSTIFFPHVADGDGYISTFILLNTASKPQSGTLRFFGGDGSPLTIRQVGGTADSTFRYIIPAGGTSLFQTDGFPATAQTGSLQLTPDPDSTAPVGAGIFSRSSNGLLMTESGIPAAIPTTHARIYVDMANGHDSGLAIAGTTSTALPVTLKAYQSDGSTPAGSQQKTLSILANGHTAAFVRQWISGLPSNFKGVLDISAPLPFAALTLRALTNARLEFLITTFPIADMNRAAPAPLVFPHLADGGGYKTEFILLSAGHAATATLSFFGGDGTPLAVGR